MLINSKLTKVEKGVRNYLNHTYYINNDLAHQIDHADEVWTNACEIINNNKIKGVDRDVLFIGVYLHDIYSNKKQRHVHNIFAYEEILYNANINAKSPLSMLLSGFDHSDIDIIANMAKYHRSSLIVSEDAKKKLGANYKYVYIIRIADKGKIDLKTIIKRSLYFNNGNTIYEAISNIINHIEEKYGPDGYLWKNDPEYKELYHDEYEKLQEDIEFLKLDEIDHKWIDIITNKNITANEFMQIPYGLYKLLVLIHDALEDYIEPLSSDNLLDIRDSIDDFNCETKKDLGYEIVDMVETVKALETIQFFNKCKELVL